METETTHKPMDVNKIAWGVIFVAVGYLLLRMLIATILPGMVGVLVIVMVALVVSTLVTNDRTERLLIGLVIALLAYQLLKWVVDLFVAGLVVLAVIVLAERYRKRT